MLYQAILFVVAKSALAHRSHDNPKIELYGPAPYFIRPFATPGAPHAAYFLAKMIGRTRSAKKGRNYLNYLEMAHKAGYKRATETLASDYYSGRVFGDDFDKHKPDRNFRTAEKYFRQCINTDPDC